LKDKEALPFCNAVLQEALRVSSTVLNKRFLTNFKIYLRDMFEMLEAIKKTTHKWSNNYSNWKF